MPSVKLVDGRISLKQEKIYSYLINNFVSLRKMVGKTEAFSSKVS